MYAGTSRVGSQRHASSHPLRATVWRWSPLGASVLLLLVYSRSMGTLFDGRKQGMKAPKPTAMRGAVPGRDKTQPVWAGGVYGQYEFLNAHRLEELERKIGEVHRAVSNSDRDMPVDTDETCRDSWVLANINATARLQVEIETAEWYDNLPSILEKLYNEATPDEGRTREPREPESWARFGSFMPSFPQACKLSRVGLPDWDGGKWICGIDKIPAETERPCVVYSIGSNDQYDFEGVVRETTNCTIETFDCTARGSVPGYMRDRVHFHKICLGNPAQSNATAGLTFMTLKQIMDMLGHTYVTLLKADIEGYEYSLFQELLQEDDIELPEQISFELHYETQFKQQAWYHRQRTAGELAMLATRLYTAGYRVLSREDNVFCKHCSEFTVARFQCSKRLRNMRNKYAALAQQQSLRLERGGELLRASKKD